jgi:Domain of unknown function (DUF4157)
MAHFAQGGRKASGKINRKETKTASVAKPAVSTPSAINAVSQSAPASPDQLVQLQQQYGNRAVSQLLGKVQRQPATKVQPAIGMKGGEAPAPVQSQIERARGGGQALDGTVAETVGGKLGADFNGVRVHTDSKADTLNRSLSAKAFTTGKDIFFSQGTYCPGTPSGQQLLTHELTHVVQQSGSRNTKAQTKLKVGSAHDGFEAQADRIAGQVGRGQNLAEGLTQGGGTVQRGWIQRLAYTDAPVPNFAPANIDELSKTPSGQEGAYKARQGGTKVWLKFTAKSDAMAAEYGNMVIGNSTGLAVPGSRYFLNGTAQFNALAGNVTAWATDARTPVGSRITQDAANDVHKEVATVMENLRGLPADAVAQDPAQHAPLIEALLRASVLKDMAEMLVIDAILGNSDRLDRGARHPLANIGNFFITPDFTHLATIDNAAERTGEITGNNLAQGFTSKSLMLKDVAEPAFVRRAVNSLCDALVETARPIDGGALGISLSEGTRQMITTRLIAAVTQARRDVVAQMQVKNNKNTMKAQHATLSQDLRNDFTKPNWDTLRIKAKYLDLRNKGASDEDAIKTALKHLEHKNQKANNQLLRQRLPGLGKIFKV